MLTVMLVPCLIFARMMTALWMATSFVPAQALSWRMRFAVACMLTTLVSPSIMAAIRLPVPDETTLLTSFLCEILRGACFGFGLCLWLIGADICAAIWGHLSGMSIDAFLAEDRRPLVRFFQLTWISVFFLTGAHRVAMRALLDSYDGAPPGASMDTSAMLEGVFILLGVSAQLGLQAGIPVAATLLAALGVTVLMSRLLPHLQTLVTSTSLGALMLLAALAVGCGPLARTLELQVGSFLATWVGRNEVAPELAGTAQQFTASEVPAASGFAE